MARRDTSRHEWLLGMGVALITFGFRCPGPEPRIEDDDLASGGADSSAVTSTVGNGGSGVGGSPVAVGELCLDKCAWFDECNGTPAEACFEPCEDLHAGCEGEERAYIQRCYDDYYNFIQCDESEPFLVDCLSGALCLGGGTSTAASSSSVVTTTGTTTVTSGGGTMLSQFCGSVCGQLDNSICIDLHDPPLDFDFATCEMSCASAVDTCFLDLPLDSCLTGTWAQCTSATGPPCLSSYPCVSDPEVYLWGQP